MRLTTVTPPVTLTAPTVELCLSMCVLCVVHVYVCMCMCTHKMHDTPTPNDIIKMVNFRVFMGRTLRLISFWERAPLHCPLGAPPPPIHTALHHHLENPQDLSGQWKIIFEDRKRLRSSPPKRLCACAQSTSTAPISISSLTNHFVLPSHNHLVNNNFRV